MSESLIIVSSDTHIGPRLAEDLRPYCPANYLDEFDAYTAANVEPVGSFGRAPGTGFAIAGVEPKKATGSRIRNFQTEGHYDIVSILEAPDEAAMTAGLFNIAQAGNVHSETLRAYNEAEMKKALGSGRARAGAKRPAKRATRSRSASSRRR